MYERREPKLYNFYEELEIPYLASDEKVRVLLEEKKIEATKSGDEQLVSFIKLAEEYLLERRTIYDKYLKRHGVEFPKTKKEKRMTLIKNTIISGTIIAIGLSAVVHINNIKEENLNSNVCVEYEVQYGDTYNKLDDMFYEFGFSNYEISGPARVGIDGEQKLFEGDIVIGRTTKEKADKLVAEGKVRIITIEEAIELLGENNSLIGEFKKAAEEKSDIVFYVPIIEKTYG